MSLHMPISFFLSNSRDLAHVDVGIRRLNSNKMNGVKIVTIWDFTLSKNAKENKKW